MSWLGCLLFAATIMSGLPVSWNLWGIRPGNLHNESWYLYNLVSGKSYVIRCHELYRNISKHRIQVIIGPVPTGAGRKMVDTSDKAWQSDKHPFNLFRFSLARWCMMDASNFGWQHPHQTKWYNTYNITVHNPLKLNPPWRAEDLCKTALKTHQVAISLAGSSLAIGNDRPVVSLGHGIHDGCHGGVVELPPDAGKVLGMKRV